ncbi:MAG TPA: ABC transporter permease [Alphaproteobacteria bacterium]|nr:ABC transporter permease [Alphaproteobacteria bacterium]
MSLFAFLGAVEVGLIFALVALAVYLSFRVLQFPDLTVDGSFPLGAAVAATLIVTGVDAYLATLAAFAAGAAAGLVTAWLNVRLKILHLLASILTMIALYSINLRIMGRPNVALLGEQTVFTPFAELPWPGYVTTPLALGAAVVAVMLALNWYLGTGSGLALRATGANPRMARAQGIDTDRATLLGMALSNGLVGLAGALFAQSQGAADVTLGVGVIVVGLAAVIGGEAVIPPKVVWLATLGCLVGSILYRLAVALALNSEFIGLQAQDLNLITAVLVGAALVLPGVQRKFGRAIGRGRAP